MRAAIALIAIGITAPAYAQWVHLKTPGLPRLADGKPNLSAPAPRTADGKPDFSGLWRGDAAGGTATGKAMESIKPQAWAKELAEKRKINYGSDAPTIHCLPFGPQALGVGKIVQAPNSLLMLFGVTLYREIHLDGRQLENDPNPSWMGYSVGHWDGDTLVIESNGFNDKTWLDDDGHPHTEALRVTERLRRPDFGHLELTKTFTDPGALLEPWTIPVKLEIDPDTEDVEYVCNENERDQAHLVGKTTDEKSVPVAPALLSKYAGDYEFKIPDTGQTMTVTFKHDGDALFISGPFPSTKMTSLSDTEFSAVGATIKFDSPGVALISTVEGDLKATKK